MAGQSRRVLLELRPADQHDRGADEFGHQPLQCSGGTWPAPAGLHQYDADDGLSRRRAPERRLSVGAAGRGSCGRDRDQFRQAAPTQRAPQRCVPDEDADRLHLRQCRSGAAAGHGAEGVGLGRFRKAAARGEARGQAARYRACLVSRAVRRHGQGAGRAARRARRPAVDVFARRSVRAGPRDGLSRAGGGHSRACPRTGSTCATTM